MRGSLFNLLSYHAVCEKQRNTGWNSLVALHLVTKFTYEKCFLFILCSTPWDISSVQFSRSALSISLQPQVLQHARLPCPSPTPRACSNSCPPMSQWCHQTISSSVVPFSCLQYSQRQGLFKWVSSWNQVAKILEFQLQHQSFQWIFRTDFL